MRRFRAALETDPDYTAAHQGLGSSLTRSGRPAEAIPHLRRTLEDWPDLVAAHVNLGIALSQTGSPDDALVYFRRAVELDPSDAENHYKREPAHEQTPERLFERRWARTLLEASLDRLREETTDAQARERFDALVPFMTGSGDSGYREAARALGMSETAARVAVHRMRRKFRKIMREEVARTVDDPGQVDDELQFLFKALAG